LHGQHYCHDARHIAPEKFGFTIIIAELQKILNLLVVALNILKTTFMAMVMVMVMGSVLGTTGVKMATALEARNFVRTNLRTGEGQERRQS
jgi:hypothetical protein